MNLLTSLIAALERTGGDRLVLRSGAPPHLLLGDTRHELGTANVSIRALEALAEQILSADGRRVFAEQDVAVEPLSHAVSAIPLLIGARRLDQEICIELRRCLEPERAVAAVTPAEPAPAPRPAPPPAIDPLVRSPAPVTNVAESQEPSDWEPIEIPETRLTIAVAHSRPRNQKRFRQRTDR